MAKHKAPTQVSIAPTEEESAFAAFVHRAWKPFALLAVVVIAASVLLQVSTKGEKEATFKSWDLLAATAGLDPLRGGLNADGQAIAGLRSDLKGSDAEAWSLYLAAISFAQDREWEEARNQLAALSSSFPQHPLNTRQFLFEGSESQETIPSHLSRVIAEQERWSKEHPELVENPALPADAPRVRIQTGEGDIVVGLYTDRAPKHCENFLKLCREGYYDGTKFHRVVPSALVQGGDPNTKSDEQATWGSGGPGYTLESEKTGLFHFKGTLGAAKDSPDAESSGSQFYIVVADLHGLDEQYVAFGTVIEGLDKVEAIAEGEVTPPDSPLDPIEVISTEVL